MTIRLYCAAVILLGIQGVAYWLKDRGMPTELARPEVQLQDLPRQLGQWTSEDRSLDPEVFKAIGAKAATDRRYRHETGNLVDLHCAVFLEYGVRMLHPPELCYSGSGFRVMDTKTLSLGQDSSSAHPVRLLTLEREGQPLYCLYWYQFGDATFSTGDDQRKLVRSFRGRKAWPPMIKVMLQTTAATPSEAEQQLRALGPLVFAWTKEFH